MTASPAPPLESPSHIDPLHADAPHAHAPHGDTLHADSLHVDPLDETLFRPTSAPGEVSSSGCPVRPVRPVGSRSRAGNTMRRTRVALLNGARAAVEHNGLAITMAEVAARSGVAKATLYNHFRTREDVLDALLTAEVTELVADCAGMSLGDGLRRAGMRLAHHPLVRALARQDPRSVLALARVDVTCDGWRLVRDVIAERLICDGYDGSIGAGVLLRWLAGCLVAGGPDAVIEAEVDVLLTGLPRVRCASSAPSS